MPHRPFVLQLCLAATRLYVDKPFGKTGVYLGSLKIKAFQYFLKNKKLTVDNTFILWYNANAHSEGKLFKGNNKPDKVTG